MSRSARVVSTCGRPRWPQIREKAWPSVPVPPVIRIGRALAALAGSVS
jgi:hypothetical protein